ncbi:MAG: GNAT family N-acetyltransferase [Rhizobiaceae bacterium]|nr:GNAT family N-acetyltransferase [Rhizobiaceae bacterium]
MTHRLRDAHFDDLDAITGIYREAVENGVSSYELTPPSLAEMTRRFEDLTAQNYPYIVAEDHAGQVLGYAYAGAYRARPAYRWTVEDSIYLAPQARGMGLGKKLLSELVQRCTSLEFRQLIAVIGGAHPASVQVHRALGFELTGTMRATGFKHGRWLDTTIMQLSLGEGSTSDPEADAYPGTLYEKAE